MPEAHRSCLLERRFRGHGMSNDDEKGTTQLPAGTSGAFGGASDTAQTALNIGRTIVRAVANHRARRDMDDMRRQEQADQAGLLAAPPAIHGSARWATRADFSEGKSKGHLRPAAAFDDADARDIFLGAFTEGDQTDWLYWDGQGHLMSIAPTRSGKATMQIIPNLLRYGGSCVVLDPKGELYEATSKYRASLGPVYRIAPFEADTHAFNPLDTIETEADVRALADLLIPQDVQSPDFFRKDAIAFLNGLIQYVLENRSPAACTMAEIRRLTALPTHDFLGLAAEMAAYDNVAASGAGKIVLGKNRERGLPSLRDTLNTELSLWDDDGVVRATRGSDVDFRTLKDRPATVYVTVPFTKMKAFAPFLKVLLTSALDGMLQNPATPKIPVLFVLDEFLSLGPFPQFRDAIMTHAGADVRLWFFLQNVAMLEEHYPTTWRSFYDATVRSMFGTGDPFTAKLISDELDTTTVAHQSSTFTLGKSVSREDFFDTGSGDNLNVTRSVSLTSRHLLTPGEVIQRLGGVHQDETRDAIVRIAGLPPVMARLVPYFKGERAIKRVGSL